MVSRPNRRRCPCPRTEAEQLDRPRACAATENRWAGGPRRSPRAAARRAPLRSPLCAGRARRHGASRRRPLCAASRRRPRPSSESPSRVRACSVRDSAAAGHTDTPCRSRPPACRPGRAWPARCSGASGRSRAVRMYTSGCSSYGPQHSARPGHRDGMAPARAAFGGQQVVPAVALVEMRCLGEAERRAGENGRALADQRAAAPASIPAARCRQTGSGPAGGPRACSPNTCGRHRRETATDRSRCCSGRSGRTSRHRCSGWSPGSCGSRAATRLPRPPPMSGRSASRRCRSDRTRRPHGSGTAPRRRRSRDRRACRAGWRGVSGRVSSRQCTRSRE